MKLKIIGLGLFAFALAFAGSTAIAAASKDAAPSSMIYQGVNKYKQKNYTGCIQDMDYAIENGKSTDIAYYYKAISYAKLGMKKEAREAYDLARKRSANRVLIDYSTQAINCIDDPTTCDIGLGSEDITTFIRSEQFMHSDVSKSLENKSIEKAKTQINNGKQPTADDLKYLNNNDQPTDKEIADAVRTFAKLGINPYGNFGSLAMYGQNSELAQMNAFLGNQNNNGNNMINLIPLISQMQSAGAEKSGVTKELVQAMMMNQMLPGLDFGGRDK